MSRRIFNMARGKAADILALTNIGDGEPLWANDTFTIYVGQSGTAHAIGGLSNPMTTLGDTIYENATPAVARLAGSTSATIAFLSQTGTGSVSAAPVWTVCPFTVAMGGTGLATLTANAVMLGAGAGDVQFATIGTAGKFLVDQGAATNPSFVAMSGDATLAANGTITLANTAVSAASYTYSSITVDSKGRLTSASSGTAPASAAVKSDQTTGTSTTVFVNPGVQQYHASAAKAWILHDGVNDLVLASYNVSSVTDVGVGDFTFNWTTSFTSANYAVTAIAGNGTGANTRICWGPTNSNPTSSAWELNIVNAAFAVVDASFINVQAHGTQ